MSAREAITAITEKLELLVCPVCDGSAEVYTERVKALGPFNFDGSPVVPMFEPCKRCVDGWKREAE